MKTIYKSGKTSTYFEGNFMLRDEKSNLAKPINFPTVFIAFGKAVHSGNWKSCTAINTPKYVIDNYFNGEKGKLVNFWSSVFKLEKITWVDVAKDKKIILQLINNANNELLKLDILY